MGDFTCCSLPSEWELVCAQPEEGSYEVVTQLPGFVRGMARYGDYLFVGLSRLRKTSATFGDLPIARQSVFAGVVVVHLPRGSIVGHLKYKTSCEEIYDVQVLPGCRRPGLMGPSQAHRLALSTPDDSFWAQEEPD